MTNKEIAKELMKDFSTLQHEELPQLLKRYHNTRKRFKIDRRDAWPKEYMIQLPQSKNNWLIVLQKSPISNKYTGPSDTTQSCVTLHYGPEGLRVFRPAKTLIEVFSAHLFSRYNERMNLGLDSTEEIIKHFFRNCGMLEPEPVSFKGKKYIMSVCDEGATLGRYDLAKKIKWLVHKTFINNEQMGKHQRNVKSKVFVNARGKLSKLIEQGDISQADEIQRQIVRLITHLQATG